MSVLRAVRAHHDHCARELAPLRVRFSAPRAERAATRVLVLAGARGTAPRLIDPPLIDRPLILPPLILHEADGRYTPEVLRLLGDGNQGGPGSQLART